MRALCLKHGFAARPSLSFVTLPLAGGQGPQDPEGLLSDAARRSHAASEVNIWGRRGRRPSAERVRGEVARYRARSRARWASWSINSVVDQPTQPSVTETP